MTSVKKSPGNVLIIGATSGIGWELARRFSAAGFGVGATGRRTDRLRELSGLLLGPCWTSPMDVCRPAEAVAAFERLTVDMGGIDIVVISAGTGHLNDSLDWGKEWNTIETNVMGFSAVAGAAMRYFLERKAGHLVGISSIAGLRGSHQAPAYNASKAFVSNYLEGLRIKAAKTGLPIFVSDIRPGLVDTAMAKGEGLFWLAPPAKAAGQIYEAIIARAPVAYVTKRWALVAFFLKYLPESLYRRL